MKYDKCETCQNQADLISPAEEAICPDCVNESEYVENYISSLKRQIEELNKDLEIAKKALNSIASEYDTKDSFGILKDRYYNIVFLAKKVSIQLKCEKQRNTQETNFFDRIKEGELEAFSILNKPENETVEFTGYPAKNKDKYIKSLEDFMMKVAKKVNCLPDFTSPGTENDHIFRAIDKLIIPKHETIEAWEKRIGEKYPDDGPVYVKHRENIGTQENYLWSEYKWSLMEWHEYEIFSDVLDVEYIDWEIEETIVANNHGKPDIGESE